MRPSFSATRGVEIERFGADRVDLVGQRRIGQERPQQHGGDIGQRVAAGEIVDRETQPVFGHIEAAVAGEAAAQGFDDAAAIAAAGGDHVHDSILAPAEATGET